MSGEKSVGRKVYLEIQVTQKVENSFFKLFSFKCKLSSLSYEASMLAAKRKF